ncbi:MAG: hypothetical protein ACYTEQ_12670 [Planctomycetota bacterium]|jgi:hypothetical protein
MAQEHVLKWSDVKDAAERIFCVFVGQPELRWARQAWQHIINAGLANYSNELERCKACVRFLALGSFYYDWCAVAYDESREDDELYFAATEELELAAFRLGQLIGREGNMEPDYLSEQEFIESALASLMHDCRDEVAKTLIAGFGGEARLFSALWRSATSEDLEEDDEILHAGLTAEKCRAYEWITEGCFPYRTSAA